MPDKSGYEPERLIDGPADADWTLLLAHGAGQGMRSAFMAHSADLLGHRGLRVIRFEFPYMVRMQRTGARRPPDREPVLRDAWHRAIELVLAAGGATGRLAIGGKSLGARMASLIADDQPVSALVCLGYPFHPPGKPDRLRVEHLTTLRTPTLICQGTRDPFGSRDEVRGYPRSEAVRLAWIDDGEHSFKPRKQSGRTWEQNLKQAAEAVTRFLATLEADATASDA